MSHSLIAVGAVGVRVPLYLGHSWWKAEPIPLLSLPYPSLIRKRYPFSAGLTERVFSRRMAQPSLELTRYGDFLHHSRAALTTRPRRLSKTMYYIQNRINVMKTNKYINKTTICCCVHAICFTILYVFGPGEMAGHYSSRRWINRYVFPSSFQRRTTSTTSCFGSLGDEIFPNRGLLLKERICSKRRRSFL